MTTPDRQDDGLRAAVFRDSSFTLEDGMVLNFEGRTLTQIWKLLFNAATTAPPSRDAAEGANAACPNCSSFLDNWHCGDCGFDFAPPKPAPDAMRSRMGGFTVADDIEVALSAPVPPADGALATGILNSLEETAKYLRRADPATIDMDGITQILLTGIKQLRPFLSPPAVAAEPGQAEIDRVRANHKDAVETKRRTDARLKQALAALQQIYTVCNDNAGENCDQRMTVNFIREVAGDGFEKATAENVVAAPVRGDREAITNAIISNMPTLTGLSKAVDAILSLPVQPGAGERE